MSYFWSCKVTMYIWLWMDAAKNTKYSGSVKKSVTDIWQWTGAVQIFKCVTITNISYFGRIWKLFDRHHCCMFFSFMNCFHVKDTFVWWQVLSECVPVPVERGTVHLAAGIRQIGPASGTERRARKWHEYHPIHWHAQHDDQQLGRVIIHPNLRGKYSFNGFNIKLIPNNCQLTGNWSTPRQ